MLPLVDAAGRPIGTAAIAGDRAVARVTEPDAAAELRAAIQEPAALRDGMVIAPRECGGAAGTGIVVQLDPGARIRTLHDSADIPLEATPRFANATGGMLNGRIEQQPRQRCLRVPVRRHDRQARHHDT